MTLSPIRARDRLVEDICTRAVTQHGMLYLVSGYAGTGKTWLLRRIGERMLATSPVAFATADEFEKDTPFSFVERLLSTGLAPFRILEPQSSPLEIAREILVELGTEEDSDLQTVIVDDAQWIDAESRMVLRYLVPRVMRRGYFIVVASRIPSTEASAVSFLADLAESTPYGITQVLDPLSTRDIQALAVDVLGASISAFTAEAVRNATGGSFLGVDSIFRRITPQERNKLHLLWDLPIRGVDPESNPLLAPMSDLSRPARTAVEIVCCADSELAPHAVAEVADRLGEDADLGPGVSASLLSESGFGSTVAPRHSLIAHAVRQSLPSERARVINRALVPTATGVKRITYALRGASEWTEELAAAVAEFVDDAAGRRNFDSISDVLRRSAAIATGEAKTRLLIRLALLNMRYKTVYTLLDLIGEFEALPAGPVKECIVLTVMAHRKDRDFPQDRLEAFLAVESDDPDERTLQAYASFFAVIEVIRSLDYSQLPAAIARARTMHDRAPTDPGQLTCPDLRWMVAPAGFPLLLEANAMLQTALESEPATVSTALDELAPRVLALEPGPHTVDSLTPLAAVAMSIGEIGRARTLAATAVAMLESVERPWSTGTVRLIHAHATSLTGSLDEAAELAVLATETSGSTFDLEARLPLSGLHAWLNAARGVPDFIDLDAQSQRQTTMAWQPYAADMVITAACERARARGDAQAVIEASAPHRVRHLVGTQRGYLSYRAHALIDLGRLEEAEALVDRLTGMSGRGWQPYWGSLDWLRARLLAARGESAEPGGPAVPGEPARATEPAEIVALFESALDDERFPLPHALTLRDFGVFLASIGRRAEARTTLENSAKTARRIGAEAYLPGIRSALAAVAKGDAEVLSSLTAREVEISRLLARGRSNQEIAAELFVAPATVRYHVSNVLRKLGLSRRSEVAQVFLANGIAVDE